MSNTFLSSQLSETFVFYEDSHRTVLVGFSTFNSQLTDCVVSSSKGFNVRSYTLILMLRLNKYGESVWTDCPLLGQMSVQHMEGGFIRATMSPFRAFAYCIRVINVVDMKKRHTQKNL